MASSDPRLARARAQPSRAATTTPPVPPPPPPPPPPPANDEDDFTDQRPNDQTDSTSQEDGFKLRFCTVCASNNNRSMEGHLRLSAAKYPVISFGTGSLVRLPGPSIDQPNVYNFNTSTYDQMYTELKDKDPRLYQNNGILNMLDRNRNIKRGPERWQDWAVGQPRVPLHSSDKGALGSESGTVDIVITCEERCWDAVVDDLLNRGSPMNCPVHVFNIDIRDSHEDALIGGNAIVDLANSLNGVAIEERQMKGEETWNHANGAARAGFDERVPEILGEWQERWPKFPATWTFAFF